MSNTPTQARHRQENHTLLGNHIYDINYTPNRKNSIGLAELYYVARGLIYISIRPSYVTLGLSYVTSRMSGVTLRICSFKRPLLLLADD